MQDTHSTSYRAKSLIGKLLLHSLLIIGAISTLLPFFWMVSTSLKEPAEAVSTEISWFPKTVTLKNYAEAWKEVPFPRYFINTILCTVIIMFSVLITSSLGAYAFARMDFPGREIVFIAFLSVMMVPQPVYLVPSYIILSKLPTLEALLQPILPGLSWQIHSFKLALNIPSNDSWIDTYSALIVPWCANVFTIFLLRQHFRSVPKDLYEAAIIDGCSRFGFLWRIMLPVSKGVLVAAGLFSIIGSWNSFMWPLVVTNSDEMRPIQVGLSFFAQEAGSQPTLQMAAATFCTIPLLVLFFFAQKQIIASFARSGLKG